MKELERENQSLKRCIEELKGQMKIVREMYTNDDFEDRRKMERMGKQIKELREEKEQMRKEIMELRDRKKKGDGTNENQNKGKEIMNKIIAERKETTGGIFGGIKIFKRNRDKGKSERTGRRV